MNVSHTSIDAFKKVDAKDQYTAILKVMADGDPWCIADLVDRTFIKQKSTMSARINELAKDGMIDEVPVRPSRTTGIKSKHYVIRLQSPMF